MYTSYCCDMEAMKREVAAVRQVTPRSNVKSRYWRQVTVQTAKSDLGQKRRVV